MTDRPVISPLIQRLAIARLVAPACVSCEQLQRSHERLSSPPGSRVSDRLFRRMEFSQPSAAGLLLARTDPSLEPSGIAATKADVAVQAAGAGIANHPAVPAQAALGNASSFVSSRLSRQSAGVTQTGTFVARKVAATPGVIASARVVQRLVERAGDRSPSVFATTAHSMSEQTSDEKSSADMTSSSAPETAGSITSPPANQPTVMRKADPAVITATASHTPAGNTSSGDIVSHATTNNLVEVRLPVIAQRAISASSDIVSHAPTNNLVGVRPPVIAQRAIAARLHRRAEDTIVRGIEKPQQNTAAAGALVLAGKSLKASVTDGAALHPTIGPTASNASAPLVLRKADVPVVPSVPSNQLPTTSTSAPGVIAREAVATPRSAPKESVFEQAGQLPSSLEIDRIVEQVESRLARRFEIERERQGVRSWRREN